MAYAYGTNTGIGAVAQGDHGHSESDLRYVARRYFTLDGARAVAVELAPAMARSIRWDLIEHYDQMIKFATAIRVGTASAEAILRRFTRNATHPLYQAMLEPHPAVRGGAVEHGPAARPRQSNARPGRGRLVGPLLVGWCQLP